MIPYLALADVQNRALAAILTFSDRVIYPTYGALPPMWGLPPLEDEASAGVIMWVPGSLAFLLPRAVAGRDDPDGTVASSEAHRTAPGVSARRLAGTTRYHGPFAPSLATRLGESQPIA